MRRIPADVGWLVAVCAAGLAGWQAVARSLVPSYLRPPPTAVAAALSANAGTLAHDTKITVLHAFIGLSVATGIAGALAIALAYMPLLRRVALPLLGGFEAIPKVALAPLIVLWIGIGGASKITIAAAIAVFPLTVCLARGLDDLDRDILDLAQVWRAPWWRILVHVRLPNALPELLDGIRLAIPAALVGAILGEFIASDDGLGHRLIVANAAFQVDLALAAVVILAAVSIVASRLVGLAERKLTPYRS